jgi:quinoprotein glucose dehydrogenase
MYLRWRTDSGRVRSSRGSWGARSIWEILSSAVCLLLLLVLLPRGRADHKSADSDLAALESLGNWPMVGRDPGGTRYSKLTQITPANVSKLKIAWIYHMKPTGGPDALHLSEDQPLVVGDAMYVVTPYSRVVALDSATGQEKWVFQIPGGDQASLRGAAYWPGGEGAGPAIIFGTRRGRMYSIDAATGRPNLDFGGQGAVDLKTPEVMTTGKDKIYILPSPPVIYKNLVITGAGTGEGPGGLNGGLGPAGDTRAWDARTGRLVWTFHSVPRPGEVGYDTWGDDSWKNRSGVNVWGYMTVDVARGILYMPFGAPNDDRVGIDRPGNNLFSSSLVAVDAATGKLLWYFQVVHHDIWDLDTEAPPTLFDVLHNGKTIPAVATVNKNALMFILDRVSGKPIYGVEERPVPKSGVPGEQTSPTQPFPVLPEPLSQNTLSRDNLYKGTPEHEAFCEKYVDDNNMLLGAAPYTPTALDRYTVTLPGTQGGVNYYGGAFDPRLGLFVVNVNNLGQPMRIVRNTDGSYSNSGPLAGVVRFWDPSNHLPCTPTPWGQLVAVDVNTDRIAWRTTLGVSDILPPGKQDTGRPGLGGAIVTASGLTFIGATDDGRFRAFDTKTGNLLWTARLPADAESTPITYADAGGTQYVAVVATGGGLLRDPLLSDSLVVFSLPGATKTAGGINRFSSPAAQPPAAESPSPSPGVSLSSTDKSLDVLPPGPGRDLTIRVCSGCHSPGLASTQHLTAQEWNDLVQVMYGRGALATDDELKQITAYLAKSFPEQGTTRDTPSDR